MKTYTSNWQRVRSSALRLFSLFQQSFTVSMRESDGKKKKKKCLMMSSFKTALSAINYHVAELYTPVLMETTAAFKKTLSDM